MPTLAILQEVADLTVVIIYTKYKKLKIYYKGKLIKEYPYPLSKE